MKQTASAEENTEDLPGPAAAGDPASAAVQSLRLQSGYALEALPGPTNESLQLRAPDGRICLRIELTPQGPLVELSAVSLSVATQGDVRLDCGRLEIDARDGVSLRSAADLHLEAARDLRIQTGQDLRIDAGQDLRLRSGQDLRVQSGQDLRIDAARDLRTRADAQYHDAADGDIVLSAGDDVLIDGDQIRMNSPRTPAEVQQRLRRRIRGGPPIRMLSRPPVPGG